MNIILHKGQNVFLNPTLLSKSFNRNTMIIIIIFSSNGRALVPEHIPLRYSDVWRQGQLPCLNFHFLPLTHSSRTLLDKHQTYSNTSFAPLVLVVKDASIVY